MKKNGAGRYAWYLLAAIVIAIVILVARRPQPLAVKTGVARQGPMMVAIEEEGEARARDRYVIAAPVSGRLARIALREGDRVRTGQVVAVIAPAPLEPRTSHEAALRVSEAEAMRQQAEAQARKAESDHALTLQELRRTERLAQSGDVSQQQLDRARTAEQSARSEMQSAHFRSEAARQQAAVARAAAQESGGPVNVRAPAAGRVLQVNEESERVVAAGTPLVVLGDAARLEVSIEVLSTDAVKIEPGALVLIDGWGGDQPLRARVRSVDPQAFRKVSALGVEEKRVHVVADFETPPRKLGDGYRVDAKIVLWSGQLLNIPASAVFAQGEQWRAFAIRGGRAALVDLRVGRRNATQVEVLAGLQPGDSVILHPGRDLEAGTPVQPILR